MSTEKHAIVALTRGYPDLNSYHMLISRNIAIYNVFYSKLANKLAYDIVLFHEGNISEEAQQYIQYHTPDMPLIFVAIPFYNMPNCEQLGYKNMCYFWAIDFIEYLKDYEYIIRIDEDCILYQLDPYVIENCKQKNIKFSSAHFQGDDYDHVVVGLKPLVYSYMKKHGLIMVSDNIRCPYTNFSIINIPFYRNTNYIQGLLAEIRQSNGIFVHRWGDLPIHGYILTFLTDPSLYCEDKTIKYYHGSHLWSINE